MYFQNGYENQLSNVAHLLRNSLPPLSIASVAGFFY